MTFELPVHVPDLATHLRDLELNAPKPTAKDIREALVAASQALDLWEQKAESIARQLDELATVRISEMASPSAVSEIQRGVKRSLLEMARRLRER